VKTIRFLKTIDIAVHPQNFDAAVARWEKLLGEKAIPMDPAMNPGGKSKAAHIGLPKGEYSCHCIGVFTYTDERAPDNDHLREHLAKHGEGVILLAFMVDDIDQTQVQARAEGFPLAYAQPERYGSGIHNFGDPLLQDMDIQLAVHDEGAYDRWKAGGH
jgi:4-hydroxyphenylpyruvate dioxygenase-like putative hemolysin